MRVIFLLAMLAGPAVAQEQVYRLSPAEREAAIASAALQPERPTVLLTPEPAPTAGLQPSVERDAILNNSLYGEARPDRRPHGEVGMFIGSGGARGIFGTTAVPLGETGMASFSFSTGRFPTFGGNFGFGSRVGAGPGWQLNGGNAW
jgi:hypothetical protein